MNIRANDIQYGGDHYKHTSYEPWDFVVHAGLDFFQGNGVKYVSRWRFKGGLVDLRKALHYAVKAKEVHGDRLLRRGNAAAALETYVSVNQFSPIEGEAIRHFVEGAWDDAITSISALIANVEAEAARPG